MPTKTPNKPVSLWLLTCFVLLFPVLEGFSNALIAVGTIGLGLVVAGAWLLESIHKGIRITRLSLILLVLYFLWSAATLFWSIDAGSSLDRLISLLMAIVLYMIVVDVVRSHRGMLQIVSAYMFGVGILVISSIGLIVRNATYHDLSNRYSALGTDPNNFGVMVVSVIPLALAIIPFSSRWFRIVTIVFTAILALVVLATASRGAALALLLVGIGYVLLNLRVRRLTRLALTAVIVGLIIFAGVRDFVPNRALTRISTPISQMDLTDSRFDVWQEALELGIENPLGTGTGTFLIASTTKQAHNTFLSAFAETGYLGLTLWGLLWMVHLVYLLSYRSTSPSGNSVRPLDNSVRMALLLSLIAVFVGAFTLNWEVRKPIYLIWGLSAAPLCISQRPKHPILLNKRLGSMLMKSQLNPR